MYVPTPIKSNLSLFAFILDGQKSEITYFKRSLPVEKEPTDKKAMEKELIQLFKDYLYP